jgi:hypothetical protein
MPTSLAAPAALTRPQAAKLALQRSQASRRLAGEQAIRATLGLQRPKSPPLSPGDGSGSAGRLQANAADGTGARQSPYCGGSKASPKSPGHQGGGSSHGRGGGAAGSSAAVAAGALKASAAGLALQPGTRRSRGGGPAAAGGEGRTAGRY